MRKSEVADTLIQPLTRHECDKAGMTWHDTTNVCGEKSEESATQTASKETTPVASTVLINIDKASQKMTVFLDGMQRYEWPVSTGLPGYTTPSGTYTASSMNEIWYSKEWDDAPMPHAIFFTKKGHAVHGTHETKKLGKPASHGWVRLACENARTLFALVKEKGLENTDIVLNGGTPGGESRVASPGRKQQIKPPKSRVYSRDDRIESPAVSAAEGGFVVIIAGLPEGERPRASIGPSTGLALLIRRSHWSGFTHHAIEIGHLPL